MKPKLSLENYPVHPILTLIAIFGTLTLVVWGLSILF